MPYPYYVVSKIKLDGSTTSASIAKKIIDVIDQR